MAGITWTAEQKQAIETVDRSVLVSAAAGSGKTAVLAERCAYLVCDAAEEYRSDVDEILVVTFTEASAAEMKKRICARLAERSAQDPSDKRLRAQIALVDTGQISTLHSFCLWMVRRWFHRAGVDATVQILDEAEAGLISSELLDDLFNELYAGESELGKSFLRLVDEYGLGDDRWIGEFVLKLTSFLVSLPDPESWLERAGDGSADRVREVIDAAKDALVVEIGRQVEICRDTAAYIGRALKECNFHVQKLVDYAARLESWEKQLDVGGDWDAVREDINAYTIDLRGGPRKTKATPEEVVEDRQKAKALVEDVRKKFLQSRLQKQLCRFSTGEMAEGIGAVVPHVKTIIALAEEYLHRYDQKKRSLSVMDFSDLERFAYGLLTTKRDDEETNPVVDELRGRFKYVLVDEFQDINPLQAHLLETVSRECTAGSKGNLFVVGDVKQSIYRFRLAEPDMFLNREQTLRREDTDGVCIDLQNNYRSFANILEGANSIFTLLMQKGCGNIAYDEKAMLKCPNADVPRGEPIELHILDREVETANDGGKESQEENGETDKFVDVSDPAQWESIEREACLIGRRITELLKSGMTVEDGGGQRALQFKDICILLRSTRHTAGPLADTLASMGIPTWADAGSGFFNAVEVQDVLSLLTVLDNTQQDIPLAAVLRSGILGSRLDEDDLVAIRVFDRDCRFHEAVRRYAVEGTDSELRNRLGDLLRRIREYRKEISLRPVADVLWQIYKETDYLAFMGGMPGGSQRRANLVAIHERARQFGQFRRQGLRRFIQFMETLQEQGKDLGSPSAVSEADNVVRIISIHKAKGLEFPVVFAAEMGRQFNRADSKGKFLLDRNAGIGLKRVEKERMIEYPTALHRWCARLADQDSMGEELRIWYVALTRPKQKLILVGTEKLGVVEKLRDTASVGSGNLNSLSVLSARSPLYWMVSSLAVMDSKKVSWDHLDRRRKDSLFQVSVYYGEEIGDWRLPGVEGAADDELRQVVAELGELPAGEPLSEDTSAADEIINRLDYCYPNLGAASVRAACSASAVKRAYDDVGEEFEQVSILVDLTGGQRQPVGKETDGARRGQVVHTALQFLCLQCTASAGDIKAELARLVEARILSAEDISLIDVDSLLWFFSTELGERIIANGDAYQREWMFMAAQPAATMDSTVQVGENDLVLVRGVVDGLLVSEAGLEVIDFKTDRVAVGDLDKKVADYKTQMQLYCSAVSEVFKRPVNACHLVFLHPRQIVAVEDALN